MTGWKLFKLRFMKDLAYQRKVLGIVIDWTTWVYIFLPFFIFVIVQYVEFWKNAAAISSNPLIQNVVVALLLLFSFNGKFRSYMQEADQLFLFDRPKLYRGLRKYAFSCSLLKNVVVSFFVFLVFLPWFKRGVGLGWEELFYLYLFFFSLWLLHGTAKSILKHPLTYWFTAIVLYISMVLFAIRLPLAVLGSLGTVISMLLLIWHVLKLIPTKKYFFHEVNEENKERSRYARMILGVAPNVEKMPIRLGKRPLFLRNSRRLFREISPEKGLLELVIKGFLRHSVYLGSYLQIIGVTLFAILLLPLWMKWVIFFLFVVFLNYNSWLKGLYEKLLDQYFFTVVPIQENIRETVGLTFKRLLFIPAVAVVGFVTTLLTMITL